MENRATILKMQLITEIMFLQLKHITKTGGYLKVKPQTNRIK